MLSVLGFKENQAFTTRYSLKLNNFQLLFFVRKKNNILINMLFSVHYKEKQNTNTKIGIQPFSRPKYLTATSGTILYKPFLSPIDTY